MIFTAHSVSAEGEYDYACGRQALQTERNPYQPEYLPSIGSIDFCRVTECRSFRRVLNGSKEGYP